MAGKKGLGPKWTFDVLARTRQTKHIGKIMRNYAIYCLLTSFSCAREGQIDWFCFMYQRRRELRQVEGGGVFKFGRAHCVIFSLFFCLYKNKNQQKIVYYFICLETINVYKNMYSNITKWKSWRHMLLKQTLTIYIFPDHFCRIYKHFSVKSKNSAVR